jgi:hypothetical protein
VCVCECECECVCVCVRERECECVSLCVCVRERERERVCVSDEHFLSLTNRQEKLKKNFCFHLKIAHPEQEERQRRRDSLLPIFR